VKSHICPPTSGKYELSGRIYVFCDLIILPRLMEFNPKNPIHDSVYYVRSCFHTFGHPVQARELKAE
jgi:hypothetical protein